MPSFAFRSELGSRLMLHRLRPDEPYTRLRDATYDRKECLHCGRKEIHMGKCSGCKWARYCSVQCRNSHWAEHKRLCCPDHSLLKCFQCGTEALSMPRCTGCKWARYCSDQCHKDHWTKHKSVCVTVSRPAMTSSSSTQAVHDRS